MRRIHDDDGLEPPPLRVGAPAGCFTSSDSGFYMSFVVVGPLVHVPFNSGKKCVHFIELIFVLVFNLGVTFPDKLWYWYVFLDVKQARRLPGPRH